MNPTSTIRTTRTILLAVVLAGLGLAVFGLFIGVAISGLVVSVMGWLALIVGVIWLAVYLTRRSTMRRTGPWRPGDEDAA
ncbi:hypothetical protein E8P82_01580 [Arthrobacter echini]|uniref:Uncharacterized protein n=1 Tax=Arthrobacter echini TaxID=1529066 RepID=A0A4S5EA63_9MICC|nr:hypothetical protein [Arthrobacter echini]THJ68621.1 hypothetical protein E8P82_01580 [Arthrobacter echini]